MALYGGLDRTKHFSEFSDPLVTATGVKTPAQRRTLARGYLGIGTDAQTFSAVQTFTAVPVGTIALSGTAGPYDSLTWNTTASGVGSKHAGADFVTTTAVALGDWANAINGKIDFGTAGRVTGLGSGVCAEVDLGAGCTQGSYAPFEAEIIMPASGGLTGTRTSFMSMNVSGNATAVGRFDTSGHIFDINGVTGGTGKAFATGGSVANVDEITAGLRVLINGAAYYLLLATSADFLD